MNFLLSKVNVLNLFTTNLNPMLYNFNYKAPQLMSLMSVEGEETPQPEYDLTQLVGKTGTERTEIIRAVVQQKIADRIAANQTNG